MKHRSMRQVVDDLHQHGRLLIVEDEVDPYLELAEIHRRVYRNEGPALLFNNVKGTQFPVVSNLFGTLDRARFLFRDTFAAVQLAVRLKTNPSEALRHVSQLWRAPGVAWSMRPRKTRRAEVTRKQCKISDLPQIVCWPRDGGPFVTLPQVLTQEPGTTTLGQTNLGMYRVQLGGNEYTPDAECGLHYQIHRGIGVHHQKALAHQQDLPVSITVGGTPAMTLAAVMPLPEGMSELMFAGALAGHRIPMLSQRDREAPIYGDADFCIAGVIGDGTKPEGPFGDHLGYYAKTHPFPFVQVKHVSHRPDAIWPATVVGRPPQEDTVFGELIHELTGPVIPTVLPGVKGVNAVDAAGVHPLLLAVGSERYTPYEESVRPQELLTQAHAILGQGQLSLAKYLWIIDGNDAAAPAANDCAEFLRYALRHVDWRRDLHFQTCTTMDTLDYSGHGLNQGSKVVIAATGKAKRVLPSELPTSLPLPDGWNDPQVVTAGVLAIQASDYPRMDTAQLRTQCDQIPVDSPLNQFPLIVLCDDSRFTSRNLENFLWTTFTRSDPARDIYGIGSSINDKHWGCTGSLIIDAREKPHHAAGLVEDSETLSKVDARATRGDALSRFL